MSISSVISGIKPLVKTAGSAFWAYKKAIGYIAAISLIFALGWTINGWRWEIKFEKQKADYSEEKRLALQAEIDKRLAVEQIYSKAATDWQNESRALNDLNQKLKGKWKNETDKDPVCSDRPLSPGRLLFLKSN